MIELGNCTKLKKVVLKLDFIEDLLLVILKSEEEIHEDIISLKSHIQER